MYVHLSQNLAVADKIMIDHSSRLTKPGGVHVSAATVCYCDNYHDVRSFISTPRDAGRERVVTDDLEHALWSDVDVDSRDVVPTYCGGVAGFPALKSPRLVDDYELAADAEVCWLLRHVAAATSTPEIEPSLGGLRIGSDDAPLMASTAPDIDCLPPYLATIPAACCGLRLPSRTVCYGDTRRRPCLNFEKMQVGIFFVIF